MPSCLRGPLRLASTVLLLGFAAAPALAGWTSNAALNLAISTAVNDQYTPVSVADGAGGMIVAWTDHRAGPETYDIYIQRVSADGVPQWTPGGVPVCTADSTQTYVLLHPDGSGGAFVTWVDLRGGAVDVYAQRFNGNGVAQWAANGIALTAAPGYQVPLAITTDGAGGAIIGWVDDRSGNVDIYAARLTAAGTQPWGANGVALCTAAGWQGEVRLVPDGSGGAIAVWGDDRSGLTDIYARRISAAGVPQWTANGIPICTAAQTQHQPRVAPDGAGGALVVWADERTASPYNHVYAQRVSVTGSVLWTPNGVAVCTATGNCWEPVIASDGSGGAIMAWQDQRTPGDGIYAQRLSSAGAPLWTANGVGVCTAANGQYSAQVLGDGAGGAIVAWSDARLGTGAENIFAQRLNASGVVQWTANGVAVTTANGSQSYPTMVPDGLGGAILAWEDYRNGAGDIFAQRVDVYGNVGSLEPEFEAVADVPDDQGGRVMVRWLPAGLDYAPSYQISEYLLWRRLVTGAAAARSGLAPAREGAAPRPGELRQVGTGAAAEFWEFIAAIPARGRPGYAWMATTGSDSMPGSIPWNVFVVEARVGTTTQYYTSRPDSGYSVDNLSPAAPGPFAGTTSGGNTQLHWRASTESDLLGYRLHRGAAASFVPGPGNLIASTADTAHVDAGHTGYFYKLAAVDVHGNVSPYTLLAPGQTTGVPGAAAPRLALAVASGNPARGAVELSFTLPVAGPVRLAVLDVAGREVAVLVAGERAAGDHRAVWTGRDRSGAPASAGVYLLRLSSGGGTVATRIAWLR